MTTLSRRALFLASAGLSLAPAAARAAPVLGAPAPDFTGRDSDGNTVSLSALRGKLVVLEWTNDGCPYVKKWYGSGAMQALQAEAASRGAVWLSVISSPPGEQGYAEGPLANELTRTRGAAPAHVLLDPNGVIARLYEAKTTPHLFMVRPDGVLGYMGGADSVPTARAEDLARATPYAREALTALAEGRPAPNAVTRPYGCVVKYSS